MLLKIDFFDLPIHTGHLHELVDIKTSECPELLLSIRNVDDGT